MSNQPSSSRQLVAKDAPPQSLTASQNSNSPLHPDVKAPSRLLGKEPSFIAPMSPGSDEGFGSSYFAPMPSSTTTTTTTNTTLQNPIWKGNFRSNIALDSQTPSLLCGRRNRCGRPSLTVTINQSTTPSFLPTPPSSICSVTDPLNVSSASSAPSQSQTGEKVDSAAPIIDSGAVVTRSNCQDSICDSKNANDSHLKFDAEPSNLECEDVKSTPIDFFQADEDLVTPLHVAVLEDVDASFFIISKAESPSQLNLHNKFGSSPIHLAAKAGNSVSLRDLILGGANVEEKDSQGETALHIACRRGHFDSVVSLTTPLSMEDPVITSFDPPYQRLPQNLQILSYEGLTSLHLACFHRHKKIIRELIRLGAEVDAPEAKSGRTPLHFAVERKDVEIVRYLLENCKADVDAATFDGATALCLAEGRGYNSMACLLRGYGADPSKGIQSWRLQEESDYGSDFDSSEDSLNSC